MPRKSSSSRSSAPRRAAPAPSRNPPPPAPASRPPPPAQHNNPPPAHPSQQQSQGGGGMLSGLGSTMAQGFSFGVGSAVARQAVNSVFGSFSGGESQPKEQPQQPKATPSEQLNQGPCEIDRKAFMECIQQNPNNSSNCDYYYNSLQACQDRNN